MKAYPKEVIQTFTKYCQKDIPSGNWLMTNGYKELVATLDAIRDDKKAFQFLMDNKHVELAAFVNAIWEDSKAFKFLFDNRHYDWAAAANIINGDDGAQAALTRAGKTHFIGLALAIQSRIREDGDKNTSPFGVIKSMFNFKKAFEK